MVTYWISEKFNSIPKLLIEIFLLKTLKFEVEGSKETVNDNGF